MRGRILLALVWGFVWLGGAAEAAVALELSVEDLVVPAVAKDDVVVTTLEEDAAPGVIDDDAVLVEADAVLAAVGDDTAGGGSESENITAGGPSEGGLDAAPAAAPTPLAQAPDPPRRNSGTADEPVEEYDPWIPFNEKSFDFNYWFDRRVLKPVAKGYDKVVPDPIQLSIRNAFENVGSIRRIVNALFQGRFQVAGAELGRFLFNSVVGVGGMFDVAKSELGLEQTDADTGQTFGIWGAGPGPYLVVPLLPPLTVRDAFGFLIDGLLNPITWFASTPVSIGLNAERAVNERSLNLEAFESVEETVLDLYSAVRNGYLQRRKNFVEEGRADSVFFRR